MSEEDQSVDVTALPKFDMPLYESEMTAKDVKIVGYPTWYPLRSTPCCSDQGMDHEPTTGRHDKAIQTVLRVLGNKDAFFYLPIGRYQAFSLVTMYEYIRFPFVSGASILKGPALTPQDQIKQHITRSFSSNQTIPAKTDHQKRVEVEDPKIVATRERKAQDASKKREKKKRDSSTAFEHVSSLEPLRAMGTTGLAIENPYEAAVETVESQEDQSLYIPPYDSANRYVHDDRGVRDDEETNSLRLGSFVDQSRRNLNLVQTEVFQSFLGDHFVHRAHVDERESSRNQAYYVPEWSICQRCRMDTSMWCHELIVYLPPATQEESNALTNATALERAWFNLGQGALAQTDILERFENLQADYDQLAKTHSECGETMVKSKHDGCVGKLEVLENQNRELSQVNKNQALRIRGLEDELARKDSAMVYAERINAERAQEKEKLVAQLSKIDMEKFDCIRKLLPTVVYRIFRSHEYKQSLCEPFKLAIQAEWAKGLAEERSEEDLLELMSRMEGFDAYADNKMFVEYDKLFEKRYPFY
nr:hypothetical protein [Tanacetum cinerariifolium]